MRRADAAVLPPYYRRTTAVLPPYCRRTTAVWAAARSAPVTYGYRRDHALLQAGLRRVGFPEGLGELGRVGRREVRRRPVGERRHLVRARVKGEGWGEG